VDPQKVRKADAGERIGTLKKQLSGLKFQQDERRLAEAAVDLADHLRERRNDAAHRNPRWPFDSVDEIEDAVVREVLDDMRTLYGLPMVIVESIEKDRKALGLSQREYVMHLLARRYERVLSDGPGFDLKKGKR
jgi:hypothetical protein